MTVIIHLAVIIVLLISGLGYSLKSENSFVLDFSKYEDIEKLQREAEKLEKELAFKQSIADKLEKELAAAQDKLDFINKKLNNPGFVSKAPEKVVAQNREDAAKLEERIAQIKKSIEEIEQ